MDYRSCIKCLAISSMALRNCNVRQLWFTAIRWLVDEAYYSSSKGVIVIDEISRALHPTQVFALSYALNQVKLLCSCCAEHFV